MGVWMSLLRYPGGKSKLKSKIIESLIKLVSLDECKHYCEPFLGGGSILIDVLSKYGKYIEYVSMNDKDVALSYLWTTIIQSPQYLIDRIHTYTPTTEDFFSFREELLYIHNDLSCYDWKDIGFKKLALHQMSYSGIGTQAGGPIGGKTQTGHYKVDCRWNPSTLEKKIKKIVKLLDQVKIVENRCTPYDFEKVIKSSPINPSNSLIYCDPPYYIPGNVLYQEKFSLEDHERLRRILNYCGSSWGVSYDDCGEIRNLYKQANITPLTTKYTINNITEEKIELLILNDILIPDRSIENPVIVRPHEYYLCERTSKNYWTKNKESGVYNNGIKNTSKDPRKVEREGLIGEMAFGKYFGLPVNLQYLKGGESADFYYNGYRIEIKTNPYRGTNHRWYIKSRRDDGTGISLNSDIYVFSTLDENRKHVIAKVKLHGWLRKSEVERIEDKLTPINNYNPTCKWHNKEVTPNIIHPLEELKGILTNG